MSKPLPPPCTPLALFNHYQKTIGFDSSMVLIPMQNFSRLS